MKKNPSTQPPKPEFLAFPDDGKIALRIPRAMIPRPEILAMSDGMLVRFNSAEGFKNFMVMAMETASLVWPDIAIDWKDPETDS